MNFRENFVNDVIKHTNQSTILKQFFDMDILERAVFKQIAAGKDSFAFYIFPPTHPYHKGRYTITQLENFKKKYPTCGFNISEQQDSIKHCCIMFPQ
jgi:hypothetical protein